MARPFRSRWQTRARRVAFEAQGIRPSTSRSPSARNSRARAPPTSPTSDHGRPVAVLCGADVAAGVERVAAQRAGRPALLDDVATVAGHHAELRPGHPQPHLPGLGPRLLPPPRLLLLLLLLLLGEQLGQPPQLPVPARVGGQ